MSKIKSMARVALLLQPWLTYSQVRNKITPHVGPVKTGTVGVYGSEIRPEIGCTLTTQSGREVLRVDLERYEAACEKYGVVGADKAELLAAATPNRKVVVISPTIFLGELAPASPAVIEAVQSIVDQIESAASVKLSKMWTGDLSGLHTAPAENDAIVREDLTAKVEAAELRSTEVRDRVKLLETQLAAAKKESDEAEQALQFLDDLASAPMSVIRAILG
jgi:hypothetical protein